MCLYDTLHQVHYSSPTRNIGWHKNNRPNHPISYLDTLIKTGSENIEAIIRRWRILFPGFVGRMEEMGLPKCVMFGEVVEGTGCGGAQEEEWVECLLEDLRAFGINADQ